MNHFVIFFTFSLASFAQKSCANDHLNNSCTPAYLQYNVSMFTGMHQQCTCNVTTDNSSMIGLYILCTGGPIVLLPELLYLKPISTFSLSGSVLTSLTDGVGDPFVASNSRIKSFNLSNNVITRIETSALDWLGIGLITLDLSRNQLTEDNFPADIGLPLLQNLVLHHNNFTLLPTAVQRLPSLARLDLAYNSLTAVNFEGPVLWSGLELLNFDSNLLKMLPLGQLLQHSPGLTVLLASNNDLDQIEVSNSTGKMSLVDLSNNNLSSLDFLLTFNFQTNIKYISVANNSIKTLEAEHLETWSQSGSVLNVSWNHITYVGESFREAFNVPARIDITANPFNCSCESAWVRETDFSVQLVADPLCEASIEHSTDTLMNFSSNCDDTAAPFVADTNNDELPMTLLWQIVLGLGLGGLLMVGTGMIVTTVRRSRYSYTSTRPHAALSGPQNKDGAISAKHLFSGDGANLHVDKTIIKKCDFVQTSKQPEGFEAVHMPGKDLIHHAPSNSTDAEPLLEEVNLSLRQHTGSLVSRPSSCSLNLDNAPIVFPLTSDVPIQVDCAFTLTVEYPLCPPGTPAGELCYYSEDSLEEDFPFTAINSETASVWENTASRQVMAGLLLSKLSELEVACHGSTAPLLREDISVNHSEGNLSQMPTNADYDFKNLAVVIEKEFPFAPLPSQQSSQCHLDELTDGYQTNSLLNENVSEDLHLLHAFQVLSMAREYISTGYFWVGGQKVTSKPCSDVKIELVCENLQVITHPSTLQDPINTLVASLPPGSNTLSVPYFPLVQESPFAQPNVQYPSQITNAR